MPTLPMKVQAVPAAQAGELGSTLPVAVAIFDGEGKPVDITPADAATTSKAGVVKQALNVADVATGADATAIAAALNGLLANLRTAGIVKV